MKIKKGFTFVEIIVVMLIISIIAAIIVPKLITYLEGAEKRKNLANARTIITSVDFYNIEVKNDNSIITPDKTLYQVKCAIVGAGTPKKDYIGYFPDEIRIRIIKVDGTIEYINVKDNDEELKKYSYLDLIDYVKNPD